jgi:hypothetical protein
MGKELEARIQELGARRTPEEGIIDSGGARLPNVAMILTKPPANSTQLPATPIRSPSRGISRAMVNRTVRPMHTTISGRTKMLATR